MKLKINENLLNKIDIKKPFPNLIINGKEIKIRNKENVYNSIDNPTTAFSFSIDQKNLNIFNLLNKKYLLNKNINNSKLIKKHKNLFDKRSEENIKIKLFNKATSTNDSIDSINKDKKNNALIKSFNKTRDNNNILTIHKKVVILNKNKDSKKSKPSEESNKNILTNSSSSERYHTIFTKYNMKNLQQKDKIVDQGQNLVFLSSKYNNEKLEIKKEVPIKKEIFSNEEIKKTEFQNLSYNNKYLNTDMSVIKNNTLSVFLPKFVNMPNPNNLKNFQNKSIFYCQKDKIKKNINLIMKHNKEDAYGNIMPITAKFWNTKNKDKFNFFKKINGKTGNKYIQSTGIKYVSVNLNILAKIPNRLVHIDSHGNKIKYNSTNNKRKRIQSQNDAFRNLKRNLLNKIRFIKNKDKSLN